MTKVQPSITVTLSTSSTLAEPREEPLCDGLTDAYIGMQSDL